MAVKYLKLFFFLIDGGTTETRFNMLAPATKKDRRSYLGSMPCVYYLSENMNSESAKLAYLHKRTNIEQPIER